MTTSVSQPVSTGAIEAILQGLPEAVVAIDSRQRVAYANPALEALLGLTPEGVTGQPWLKLIPRRLRNRYQDMYDRHVLAPPHSAEGGLEPLLYALDVQGNEVPVLMSFGRARSGNGDYVIAVMRDASRIAAELKRATEHAHTDPLTGLPNRRGFLAELGQSLKQAKPFALLYFDLCGFKPFNDLHGHPVGDAVLRLIGHRMREALRGGDCVARVGGDEFAMLLRSRTQPGPIYVRAMHLARVVAAPFRIDQVAGRVHVNVGIASYPGDADTPEALIDLADRRMYRAKSTGVACLEPAVLETARQAG
jgi:c-di-GMP phosphodiesterase Gmr